MTFKYANNGIRNARPLLAGMKIIFPPELSSARVAIYGEFSCQQNVMMGHERCGNVIPVTNPSSIMATGQVGHYDLICYCSRCVDALRKRADSSRHYVGRHGNTQKIATEWMRFSKEDKMREISNVPTSSGLNASKGGRDMQKSRQVLPTRFWYFC